MVSITSQGQISIPIRFRRELGLDKLKKAIISRESSRIIIEPAMDFLDLKGSLKTKIKATSRQIRNAFEEYLAEEAVKGLR